MRYPYAADIQVLSEITEKVENNSRPKVETYSRFFRVFPRNRQVKTGYFTETRLFKIYNRENNSKITKGLLHETSNKLVSLLEF